MLNYKYRDKATIIHRLNPFCKLAWIGGAFVLALIFDNPLYILLLCLATLPPVILAKVGKEWASLMKLALYLSVAVIVINALVSYQGDHVLYQAPFKIPLLGAPTFTLEAILFGMGNSLRLLAIISSFTLLTLTIHPDDLMLAMLKMRLPYKSVMVTLLSTRFVPTLFDDVERITDVQRSRGLELDKGNLIQKVRGHMAIIVPLLSNSLDRTVQVAEAMESRAFGSGTNRTSYREIRVTRLDVVTLFFCLLPCAWGIFMRCLGQGSYQYYPSPDALSLSGLELSMLLTLVLLLLMMIFMAQLKGRTGIEK